MLLQNLPSFLDLYQTMVVSSWNLYLDLKATFFTFLSIPFKPVSCSAYCFIKSCNYFTISC